MKYTLTIVLSFIVMTTYALPSDTVAKTSFGCFQVNNNYYYLVGNCNPGSDVEFYSQPWGGDLLQTLTTDSTGSLMFIEDTSFHPAFALNPSKMNSQGKKGTGMVGFKQQIEFNLQDMCIRNDEKNVNIYWLGQTYNNAPVNYEVTKSKNGIETTVATYTGNMAGQYYMYSGDFDPDATYSIRVVNLQAGVRYKAPLSTITTDNGRIKIYPTQVSRIVNIVVPSDNAANLYHIVDMQGKIVANGSLHNGKNGISTNTLTSGNYIVFTPGNPPVKIVKE